MNKFGDLVFGCKCGAPYGLGKLKESDTYSTRIQCKRCRRIYQVEIKDGQLADVSEIKR